MHTITDEDLVDSIVQNNDTKSFEILYDRYSDKVYRKCLGFIRSQSEAEDLTHDILVKAYVQLKTFKGTAKFSTWLYSLTYNHCSNYISRSVNNIKDIDIQNIDNEEYSDEINDGEILALSLEKLKVALEKIDTDDRLILLMKYQDDFSIKSIMDILNLKESAVKMRLSRAKQNLLKVYGK